jgi:hypothetical protein
LIEAIKKNLAEIALEFTNVQYSTRINNTTSPYFISVDFERAIIIDEHVHTLGLSLLMEGFKKAGVNTFSVWKELYINLQQFKYGVGKEQHQPWIEKLYHQNWTEDEISELAERWCEEVIEDITQRIGPVE